jgi:hypothetical protein
MIKGPKLRLKAILERVSRWPLRELKNAQKLKLRFYKYVLFLIFENYEVKIK